MLCPFLPSPEPHRDDADAKALTSWRLSPDAHKLTHTRTRRRKTTPSSVSRLGGNVPDHLPKVSRLSQHLASEMDGVPHRKHLHSSWGSVFRHANATHITRQLRHDPCLWDGANGRGLHVLRPVRPPLSGVTDTGEMDELDAVPRARSQPVSPGVTCGRTDARRPTKVYCVHERAPGAGKAA